MLECPNCRRGFQEGTHFCGFCGMSLRDGLPAVVTPNYGHRKLPASGRDAPGSQAKDSLEATLMFKRSVGFSWQTLRTKPSNNEPLQASGRAFSEAEESASAQSISPHLPSIPTTSTTPASPVLSAFQMSPGIPGTSGNASLIAPDDPAASTVSSLTGTPGASHPVSRATQASGEHITFAIPARPSRSSGAPTTDQRLSEASDDGTSFALLTRVPTTETPGSRSIAGLPEDASEEPGDYPAFTPSFQERASPDFLGSVKSVDVAITPAPTTRPLDEALVYPDFLTGMATLPAPSSGMATFAPEIEALVESAFSDMIENPLSSVFEMAADAFTLPSPSEASIREDASRIPTVPVSPTEAGDEIQSPIVAKTTTQLENDTEDISQIPTVPAASASRSGQIAGALPADWQSLSGVSPEVDEIDPVAHFAPFFKPAEVPAHLLRQADSYFHLKVELAAQRVEITAAMDELLPLVYDNHREENQALFASILARRPALDDEAWGHAAFVLGAYGNYMYRHPISLRKKLEIWRAQLWAVYYERSYRRKYLAQRCQQLIHFFQGCIETPTFPVIALYDLETLYLYLEPGSLRKLQQILQSLPVPPEDLLQRIEAQLVVAEDEKAERIAKQLAQQKKPALSAQGTGQPATQSGTSQLATRPEQTGAGKQIAQSGISRPATRAGQTGTSKQAGVNRSAGQPGQMGGLDSRKWPGFWSEEQRRQFFASLRADRLEVINQLLLQTRQQILAALRAELLNTSALQYQRPRKSVPIRLESRHGLEPDRFAEAFRLLNSQKLKDQQTALRLFEQNMRENIRQEHELAAREWMLYARAIVQGSTRVAPDWERSFKRGEASWEEIWNLAYYHRRTNDLAEAVRVLTPGLDELDAPISHLHLALICALTLLLEPESQPASALQDARSLLIHHLERWPHPLSGLAWLVLSYEAPGTLRPLEQSRHLGLVQELLEWPVELPDPRNDLTEPQLNALEDTLVQKTHCEEAWFLWLNDYAARHPHNFLAWERLAETSEHMERLVRAEIALQHIAGIYYDLDYVYVYDGDGDGQAAAELRGHVERLFEFYRRHEMQRQAWDSFESCYATLNHLGFWDEQRPVNRKLLSLVAPFLIQLRRQEARRLESQRLVETRDAKYRAELIHHEVSNNPTLPLDHFKSGQRVGVFVDYENIAHLIPRQNDIEEVWQGLAAYAAQFGEVICRWASASPRNLSNLTNVRTALEAAHFKIRYPRRELQFSASQKDLADYALLECINTASLNDRLDVYLVVSGDRDYYERIYSLLESGSVVRILASDCNLSTSYRELEQQRQRQHKEAGDEESDFFIDNLDDVLSSLPPASY